MLSFAPVLTDHLPLSQATSLTQADSTKQAQKYLADPGIPRPITYPLTISLGRETLSNSDCLKRQANLQHEQGEECCSLLTAPTSATHKTPSFLCECR